MSDFVSGWEVENCPACGELIQVHNRSGRVKTVATSEMHNCQKLPAEIEKALSHLRAMTTPYFTGELVEEAEQALRVAILKALPITATRR